MYSMQKTILQQAKAELGQAQLQLELLELISVLVKVEIFVNSFWALMACFY